MTYLPPIGPAPRKSNNWVFVAIVAAVVVAILAAMLVFTVSKPGQSQRDELGCLRDVPASGALLVIIDQSDPFTQAEIDNVVDIVRAESRSLPSNGRLILLGLNPDDYREPQVFFERCSPGTSDQMGFWERLNHNLVFVENDWEQNFNSALVEATQPLLTRQSAPQSPIIETILEAVQRRDFRYAEGERKILLVTDLLQHTVEPDVGFSVYPPHAMPDLDTFLETRLGRRLDRRSNDLEGVLALAFVVERTDPNQAIEDRAQSEELREFWRQLFEHLGAEYQETS